MYIFCDDYHIHCPHELQQKNILLFIFAFHFTNYQTIMEKYIKISKTLLMHISTLEHCAG